MEENSRKKMGKNERVRINDGRDMSETSWKNMNVMSYKYVIVRLMSVVVQQVG